MWHLCCIAHYNVRCSPQYHVCSFAIRVASRFCQCGTCVALLTTQCAAARSTIARCAAKVPSGFWSCGILCRQFFVGHFAMWRLCRIAQHDVPYNHISGLVQFTRLEFVYFHFAAAFSCTVSPFCRVCPSLTSPGCLLHWLNDPGWLVPLFFVWLAPSMFD